MPKTDAFEKNTAQYDAWFDRNPDSYRLELETIRQLLPPPPAKGLEVGVGTGKFATPLGIKIGVEPAKQMALRAEQKGIQVLRAVAENLPFPEEAFDFVLMVTTICFLNDIQKAFKEARRVLKTGGSLIIGFVDKTSALGKQYYSRRSTGTFYREAVFFSTVEVQQHLLDTGFENLTCKQTLIPGETTAPVQDGHGKGAFTVVKADKIH